MKEYKIIHHHTIMKEISYCLYNPKNKIPCILIEHYGNYNPNSDYNFCYKQEIIEKTKQK